MKTLAQYIIRQHELKKIMEESDKYASKCFKLGLVFKDAYPEKYKEYILANDEYNQNETIILPLKQQADAESYQKVMEFKQERENRRLKKK